LFTPFLGGVFTLLNFLLFEIHEIRLGKHLDLFLDSVTISRERNPASIFGFLADCGNLAMEITECRIDNYQSLNSQRYDNCTGRVLERTRLLEGTVLENDNQEIDWSIFTHPTARIG
jgi:hypothetical protein